MEGKTVTFLNNIRWYTKVSVLNDVMYYSIYIATEITQALMTFAAAFYCNMGNYKGFGDTKFIPGLSKVSI